MIKRWQIAGKKPQAEWYGVQAATLYGVLDPHRRWHDILKYLLWVGIIVFGHVVSEPAFLRRGLSCKRFAGFLPGVALIVGTLVYSGELKIVMQLGCWQGSRHTGPGLWVALQTQ
jgi:hypothetical protein